MAETESKSQRHFHAGGDASFAEIPHVQCGGQTRSLWFHAERRLDVHNLHAGMPKLPLPDPANEATAAENPHLICHSLSSCRGDRDL
jgi:hypothetical protein